MLSLLAGVLSVVGARPRVAGGGVPGKPLARACQLLLRPWCPHAPGSVRCRCDPTAVNLHGCLCSAHPRPLPPVPRCLWQERHAARIPVCMFPKHVSKKKGEQGKVQEPVVLISYVQKRITLTWNPYQAHSRVFPRWPAPAPYTRSTRGSAGPRAGCSGVGPAARLLLGTESEPDIGHLVIVRLCEDRVRRPRAERVERQGHPVKWAGFYFQCSTLRLLAELRGEGTLGK